jgi:D-beta-D-heptose 7-phosphate kinase/D-beta-D-heptose 1-phosphate adenosyltransferase
MLDRYFWGEVNRISPEAPVPIVHVTKKSARLGGAANVAANLRALGVGVKIAGVIGDDREGGEVKKLLAQQGIDSGGIVEVPRRETTEKVRIIARSQQVVRADFESDGGLDDDAKDRLFEVVRAHADECAALLISDYGKGAIAEDYWYRRATVITPNVKEALRGSSLPPGTKDVSTEGAFRIRDELELDALLVTRGERGMSLYYRADDEPRDVHIPTVAKEVYDVTGAGDTVIGVLAAGLGAGVDILDAVLMANQAASEVVKEVGTSAVSRESLLDAFDGTGR